jgi:hypothetical protein
LYVLCHSDDRFAFLNPATARKGISHEGKRRSK